MAGRECYHCKQWVEEGEEHDCWTTTEAALTQDLSEDLQDAWERLRETAVSFGDQRIYASHKSIMFSRKSCYFFVRPKKNFLEVCVFLGRALKAPQVRRVDRASKSKVVHFIQISTATRWRRRSPTGFGKHTNCLTCWPQTPARSAATRLRNPFRSKRQRSPLRKAWPQGIQSGGKNKEAWLPSPSLPVHSSRLRSA